MKRLLIPVGLSLGVAFGALAKPSQIYQNLGPLTNAPQVDATIFYNASIFDLNTAASLTNISSSVSAGFSPIPYATHDTVYFTNTVSGVMSGVPGFQFDTVTAGSRHSAAVFENDGLIEGTDLPGFPEIFSTPAGTTAVVADSQPTASQVTILATNIANHGAIEVGNFGVITEDGNNVDNSNGALIAGGVDTGSGFPDPIDTTGGDAFLVGFLGYFVNPPGAYDLYWGVSNGGTMDVTALNPPQTFFINTTFRLGIFGGDLPLLVQEANPNNFESFVFESAPNSSNTYFNIVFLNTNFVDINGQPNTNITANVEFNGADLIGSNNLDINGQQAMVQFTLATTDVTTGDAVTNGIYFLDNGAGYTSLVDDDNAGSADGYKRANAFTVTTTTPFVWPGAPPNIVYDPALIYAPNSFITMTPTYQAAEYGVQIGRNPGQLDGSFNFPITLAQRSTFSTNVLTNFLASDGGLEGVVALPDPTNEPGRIRINAKELNLSNTRLRSEGMVIINSSNTVGQSSGYDWGEINARLGATNGNLMISNFFPTNFQRLRGDIYASAVNWQNTFTNGITNIFHYHLLVVGQNLGGNFNSAIRDLNLSGASSVTTQDPLFVIQSAAFNTTNLNFNANVTLTQAALNFSTAANAPKLKNFFNNTNATFSTAGEMNFGYDATRLPVAPAHRRYTVNSVTNFGNLAATAPIFQSASFENDGSILASNNGSILIYANSIGLGLALTNTTNSIVADQNVTLSGNFIGITNSVIFAGGTNTNGQGVLTLQTSANGEITDFTAGDASTNGFASNFWQVTGGFSLPVKPATGDLFGTEITTIANNFTVAVHTWAGMDLGATPAGFSNNMVIGHLKLSKQSPNGILHFTGATSGGQYGMYVDYFELDTNSYSTNYRSALVIDPNLTIYFAAANVDPIKLEAAYTNRMVWVPNFYGPNSTVSVPYTNCAGVTQFCLMNASLAFSPVIAFFGTTPNAFNQPFVLNDPTGNCTNIATNFTSCGGGFTTFRDLVVKSGTGSVNNVNFDISTVGSGVITPGIKQKQVAAGKTYTLTATPSKGWSFGYWTALGLPSGLDLTSRVLKFTVTTNVMLTATFVPETFTLEQGAYYGLFMDTNNLPTPATSGWFTMTVSSDGHCSGRLLMGPDAYSFSSKFLSNGVANVTARHGSQTINAVLQLDMTGQSGQVAGYVELPAVQLVGNLTPNWTGKNPSPYAGQFTMILTNGASNGPSIGDSFAALTISKTGVLSVAGQLADGNAFSQSTPISKDGLWPFYSYVDGGQDLLLGWVSFESNPVHGPSMNPTNVYWSKGAVAKGKYYPGGFTNAFALTASLYGRPGKGLPVLTLAVPKAILSGGGLSEPSTNAVATKNNVVYSSTNLTLSVNPAAGTFSGLLRGRGGKPSTRLNGVVLQGQESGFGFFLDTNKESGVVLLQGQ